MKQKNNVNAVAFFNILGPVILNGINFFTIPIFTRILGTDNYGLYTIYSTWVNTFSILISLQVMGTVGVANVRISKNEIKSYYSSIITLVWISFAFWFALVLMAMPMFSRVLGISSNMVFLMLFHALGMAFVNFATMRYTYEKRSQFTFMISIFVAIVGAILSIVLIQHTINSELYYGRAYGAAIPYIVIGIVLAAVYMRQGKVLYSKKYWKFCLPICLPVVFHALSQVVLAQADKVMLQNMMNDSIVGIYSFTYTFAHVMNIIYNSFNNTWVPFYYDDIKEKRMDSIYRRTKNYITVFTLLSMGFMLLAPDVIKLFAGEDYWLGISLVPIFVVANYMMFLYSFPVNYEFYHKKTIHIASGTSGAAVINCVLNYLLIPVMGMAGAAYATLIAYVLLWIFHHMISKYVIKENYHYRIRQFIPGLVAVLMVAIMVMFIEKYIIIRWGMAMVVGIVLLRHFVKTKAIF